MKTTEQRFWEKVEKQDNGCWVWKGAKRHKGYGAFVWRKDGKPIQGRAHRYSYELHKGEISPGLFVLHTCDNPACVNPDHLFLGTNADNVRDMMQKNRHRPPGTHCGSHGRWQRGEEHHSSRLTVEQVKEIRRLHAQGCYSYAQLGAKFGVNGSSVYKIVTRQLWKHVT